MVPNLCLVSDGDFDKHTLEAPLSFVSVSIVTLYPFGPPPQFDGRRSSACVNDAANANENATANIEAVFISISLFDSTNDQNHPVAAKRL
jgi:hypothetical protein